MLRPRGPGRPYAPTAEDKLWLLRAVSAEGEPRERVAQALIGGFLASRARGYEGTLARYVRAYSQPVNPRWFPDGDLYLSRLAKASSDDERARLAREADRRPVISSRTTFTRAALNAVSRALAHDAPVPATDFASRRIEKGGAWVKVGTAKPNENQFWRRPNAAGWTGYEAAKSGALVLLALIAFMAWRHAA